MSSSRHHRPSLPGSELFEATVGGADPASVSEAADRAATLLVRGARATADAAVAQRLTQLAETEGLEALAELWSGAMPDSLAGSLWRLYLLHTWVYADPVTASRQYDAGRASSQFARVVAGVADPPGPDELRRMIDQVLGGIATADFADVLLRASAFARVVAAGRAVRAEPDAVAMLTMAEQLEAAGHCELSGTLA